MIDPAMGRDEVGGLRHLHELLLHERVARVALQTVLKHRARIAPQAQLRSLMALPHPQQGSAACNCIAATCKHAWVAGAVLIREK